jgi:hypothetical protein
MTRPREYDRVVPLHLIPITIAQRIREKGGNLYRISIIRTDGHHYTIKTKCRAKIAIEPAKKNEDPSMNQAPDCSVVPAPEPVTGPSTGNLRQELFYSPCDKNPGPDLLPAPSGRIPGQETVLAIPGGNPVPESLSGQSGTVENNG